MVRITTVFVAVSFLCLGVLVAQAQEASITPIVFDDPLFDRSYARDVSDTGVVVGSFTLKWNKSRAFRWSETDGLAVLDDDDIEWPYAEALGISADGQTIVGHNLSDATVWNAEGRREIEGVDVLAKAWAISSDGYVIVGENHVDDPEFRVGAFRTTQAGTHYLEPTADLPGNSFAYGVSANGEYVVGKALGTDGYYHAFRWSESEGMRDLGAFGPGDFEAHGITDDGSTVVGYGLWTHPETGLEIDAFEWNEIEGMKLLDRGVHTVANAISGDGNIVVGHFDIWTDGEQRYLPGMAAYYGADLTGWDLHTIWNVSGDGTRIVGSGLLNGIEQGFVIKYPAPPRVVGVETPTAASQAAGSRTVAAPTAMPPVRNGSVVKAKIGEPITLAFRGVDPGGDELRFFAEGLPAGASVTPAPGPIADPTFQGKLTWTPTAADLRLVRNAHLYVRDVEGRRGSLRFKLLAVPAVPPTVDAIDPVRIECVPGANRVKLQTTVKDPESDQLTVTWRVEGKVRKTQTVAAGSVVAFEFDYPHGENQVVVEVSDSFNVATAETTVTVHDTRDPIVIVAPQIKLPVQPGELYTLRSSLKPPRVEDACDEAPKISVDAPAKLPVGTTVVTWTVKDASGNVAKAQQTVIVVNEAPVARAGKNVRKTTVSDSVSVRLDGSKSYDPNGHTLKYSWRARGVRFKNPKSRRPVGQFKPGSTEVTLTVTDEGGRRSTDTMTVMVRKKVAHRPAAAAARIAAANAYETAVAVADDPASQAAAREASAARFLGLYADTEAEVDAGRATYELVRARQSLHAKHASSLLYGAYLTSGDARALTASAEAYRSMLHAQMDIAE